MKKFTYILILIMLPLQAAIGQKMMDKSWDANSFNKIVLDSDDLYKVNITTTSSLVIQLKTKVEGETYNDVAVTIKQKGKTLFLSTGYTPYFKAENDKLAAHKVLAVEMILEVPENFIVEVVSKYASVKASGTFRNLKVQLDQGGCKVKNFSGNAQLQSKNGDIKVKAKKGIAGSAISKYGTTFNTLPKDGNYKIIAESRNGSIRLEHL